MLDLEEGSESAFKHQPSELPSTTLSLFTVTEKIRVPTEWGGGGGAGECHFNLVK